MIRVITLFQLIFAVILIITVLLQQKGSGLGASFGGSNNIYTTKRGIDAVLYKATILISILFFGMSLLRVIL